MSELCFVPRTRTTGAPGGVSLSPLLSGALAFTMPGRPGPGPLPEGGAEAREPPASFTEDGPEAAVSEELHVDG